MPGQVFTGILGDCQRPHEPGGLGLPVSPPEGRFYEEPGVAPPRGMLGDAHAAPTWARAPHTWQVSAESWVLLGSPECLLSDLKQPAATLSACSMPGPPVPSFFSFSTTELTLLFGYEGGTLGLCERGWGTCWSLSAASLWEVLRFLCGFAFSGWGECLRPAPTLVPMPARSPPPPARLVPGGRWPLHRPDGMERQEPRVSRCVLTVAVKKTLSCCKVTKVHPGRRTDGRTPPRVSQGPRKPAV